MHSWKDANKLMCCSGIRSPSCFWCPQSSTAWSTTPRFTRRTSAQSRMSRLELRTFLPSSRRSSRTRSRTTVLWKDTACRKQCVTFEQTSMHVRLIDFLRFTRLSRLLVNRQNPFSTAESSPCPAHAAFLFPEWKA